MAKKLIIVAVVAVLALGGWLAWYYSDTQVIKRQLVALATDLSKEGRETPVQMALKLRNIMEMLGDSCEVHIPERRYRQALEQDLLIRYLIYHRSRYELIDVAFADVAVDLPATGQAVVQSTVQVRRALATTPTRPEVETRQEPVTLALVKGEKKWLFTTVTMPEALVE
jgi:hypothetical protein